VIELRDPTVGWAELAQGFGVEASRAETIEAFDAQFASAMAGKGPRLIEAVIG
jgi:acetolactate synthase-1/2/3 large subunit